MAAKYKNEVGNIYGKLTVVEFSHSDKNNAFWVCSCECGGSKVTRGITLRSGKCKSCGDCDIQKTPSADAVFIRSYRGLLSGARLRKLSVDLSFDQYKEMVKQDCHYCGTQPYEKHYLYSRRRYSKGIDSDPFDIFNGIDRVDSDSGYIVGNVVSCCFMCNGMKSDLNKKIFLNKIKEIYEHRQKNGDYSSD